MNPDIIIYGFLIFFSCLIIHILIWRIKVPTLSSLILIFIFLIIPFLGLSIILVNIAGVKYHLSLDADVLIEVFFLHLSLSLIYIASYPAVEAHSPSLVILLMIASSPFKKMTAEDIIRYYSASNTIVERVEDLKVSGLITEGDKGLQLRPLAKVIIRFYILYRKMLGLPPGEG